MVKAFHHVDNGGWFPFVFIGMTEEEGQWNGCLTITPQRKDRDGGTREGTGSGGEGEKEARVVASEARSPVKPTPAVEQGDRAVRRGRGFSPSHQGSLSKSTQDSSDLSPSAMPAGQAKAAHARSIGDYVLRDCLPAQLRPFFSDSASRVRRRLAMNRQERVPPKILPARVEPLPPCLSLPLLTLNAFL